MQVAKHGAPNAVSFSSARTRAIPKRRKAFHRFLHTFTNSARVKIIAALI
jgi:hypothetical protein